MNGAAGTWLGVEYTLVRGIGGDDTLDASAVTSIIADQHGGPDDDFVAPGTQATLPFALFEEDLRGGSGVDTLSYGTRSTSVVIDNNLGLAGHSANADCDVADAGDEADDHVDFEVFEGGSGGDCLVGDAGTDEVFVPGDGDDDITGNGGDDDALDYSSSSAGMTIDQALETATGQGSDTFDSIFNFFGSAFDDVLIWDGDTDGFAGGDGIDTVDASATTGGESIDLDLLDDMAGVVTGPLTADSTENALGGSGNDDLEGNDLRNLLVGNAGDDTLEGFAGNDTLDGGAGNDTFDGGTGADRVSFQTNTTNGVNVDLSLGFATSAESGDDGFVVGTVEIIQGSNFSDSITGGGGVTAVNFIFTGGGGNDRLTGSGSNDTLRGGPGNDRMRGLEGGDTLRGGPGARDRAWGGPGVDFCKAEFERGCE
jgi:Ca2+-binding RTX toxin-like protein